MNLKTIHPTGNMDSQEPSGQRPHDSALLRVIHWHKLFDSDTPPRLGMEVKKRLPYTTIAAFASGMTIGSFHGSKKASYQFRAENAHRYPTTSAAWFQYHKSKNYASVVGGVKDGMKLGFKLGAGAFAFCLFEETVDYARDDTRDFLSTVTAGLSFSGIYSLLGMLCSCVSGLREKRNLTYVVQLVMMSSRPLARRGSG